jgi:antitoxin MazE2
MTMLSFRVAEAEAAEVQRWAESLGLDRSELLREALHRHLVRLRSEADIASLERMPPTEAEQALAQAADWGPAEDWEDWADAKG